MADPAPPPAEGVAIPGGAESASEGPIVQIRLFEPRDTKEVRMLLGMGEMEQLALANTLLYTNPFLIAAWVLVSSAMIQFMSWWPEIDGPAWRWLMPLPALASCAVPFLFAVDWLNRAYFEHLVRHVLAREDTMDIPSYYSSAPGSAFWVLQYKGNPIGLVATDTYQPESELRSLEEIVKESEVEKALEDEEKDEKKAGKGKRKDATKGKEQPKEPKKLVGRVPKKTSAGPVVYVRHFHLDSPYRSSFIQNDLFAHGLVHAFSEPSVQKAYFRINRLTPWLGEVSRTMGMTKCEGPPGAVDLEKVGRGRGLQGWREWWVGVSREDWEKRYAEMKELHGL